MIKTLVDKSSKKICINEIASTKTGGILINFPTKTDLDETKAILDQSAKDLELTSQYPTKKQPKISIRKIDISIPEDQIKNVILEQNDFIREKLENSNDTFELLFTKPEGDFTKRAIFKCSPNIRSLIMKRGCVYIDYTKCDCSDNLFIHQCLHCAGFGHTVKFCHQKSVSKVSCIYCAGEHCGKDCPNKNNYNKHCCVNCLASPNREIRDDGISHNSTSHNCPIYIQELTKLTLQTDYGCDFVLI